jgi:hypothetical protein
MTTIEQIKTALQTHIAEAEAATAGPWHTHEMKSIYIGNGSPGSLWEIVYSTEDLEGLLEYIQKQIRKNAAFIAHARAMSPAACKCLLLAIEWLEEEAKSTTLVQHGEDSDNQPYISSFPTSEASQAKRRLQSIRQEWHNLTTK